MQPATLAERDQLLHHRTQLLRLGQRGGDLFVLQQRDRHVAEHGKPMASRDAELAAAHTVTHWGRSLNRLSVRGTTREQDDAAHQNGSSSRLARSSMFSGG